MKQKNKLVAWQLWVSFKGKNVIATSRFANLSFQLEKIITRIVANNNTERRLTLYWLTWKNRHRKKWISHHVNMATIYNIITCDHIKIYHLWSYYHQHSQFKIMELKAQVWEEHIDKEKLLPQIQLASKPDTTLKIGGSPCARKMFGMTRRSTLVALYQGVLWLGVSFCCLYRRWHPGGVGGGLAVT